MQRNRYAPFSGVTLKGLPLYKYLIFNISLLAVFSAAYMTGWTRIVWDNDPTGITAGIALLTALGVCGLLFGAQRFAEYAGNTVTMLGLIGTVVGFIIAFSNVDANAAQDTDAAMAMISTILQGMGVALYTTLAGGIGWLVLKTNFYAIDG